MAAFCSALVLTTFISSALTAPQLLVPHPLPPLLPLTPILPLPQIPGLPTLPNVLAEGAKFVTGFVQGAAENLLLGPPPPSSAPKPKPTPPTLTLPKMPTLPGIPPPKFGAGLLNPKQAASENSESESSRSKSSEKSVAKSEFKPTQQQQPQQQQQHHPSYEEDEYMGWMHYAQHLPHEPLAGTVFQNLARRAMHSFLNHDEHTLDDVGLEHVHGVLNSAGKLLLPNPQLLHHVPPIVAHDSPLAQRIAELQQEQQRYRYNT